MIINDPIADMLTRIRNAIAVNKHTVLVPYSKLKMTILEQLIKNGYIDGAKIKGEGVTKTINVSINRPGSPYKITSISRVSKPGRRVYSKSSDIPRIKSGRGIVLVSTSKGILTGSEATVEKLGGELICKVY